MQNLENWCARKSNVPAQRYEKQLIWLIFDKKRPKLRFIWIPIRGIMFVSRLGAKSIMFLSSVYGRQSYSFLPLHCHKTDKHFGLFECPHAQSQTTKPCLERRRRNYRDMCCSNKKLFLMMPQDDNRQDWGTSNNVKRGLGIDPDTFKTLVSAIMWCFWRAKTTWTTFCSSNVRTKTIPVLPFTFVIYFTGQLVCTAHDIRT